MCPATHVGHLAHSPTIKVINVYIDPWMCRYFMCTRKELWTHHVSDNSFQVVLYCGNILISKGVRCSSSFHKAQTVGCPQHFLLHLSAYLCCFCSIIALVWLVRTLAGKKHLTSEKSAVYSSRSFVLHWVCHCKATQMFLFLTNERKLNFLTVI